MHRLIALIFLSILTSACVAQNPTVVQPAGAPPEPVEVSTAEGTAPNPSVATQSPQAEPILVQSAPASLSNQIDQLNGRLTLVQEQIINQRSLSEQQLELTQAVLQRLQLLTQSSLLNNQESEGGEGLDAASLEQLDSAIGQLLQVANEMQLSTGGGQGAGDWAIESVVTNKGWVLIRYKPLTGETWLAENGSWSALNDNQNLQSGLYQLILRPRDTDSKGYVAVRLNQVTGETWWLNDRTWQAY